MYINEQELRIELENIYHQFSMNIKRSLSKDGLGIVQQTLQTELLKNTKHGHWIEDL